MITITVVINKNSVSPDIQLGSFFFTKTTTLSLRRKF